MIDFSVRSGEMILRAMDAAQDRGQMNKTA